MTIRNVLLRSGLVSHGLLHCWVLPLTVLLHAAFLKQKAINTLWRSCGPSGFVVAYSDHLLMRRHLPLFTACTLLFRAGACAARFGASKNILCTTRWETCSRLLEFSARPPRANCCRPIAAQLQSRVLSSFHPRCFSSSSSSNSNDGQASSTHTVFEPALTIPRFLRAFAIAQAAVCFVNGAVLIVLHNPLNGGSLRSVRSAFTSPSLSYCYTFPSLSYC